MLGNQQRCRLFFVYLAASFTSLHFDLVNCQCFGGTQTYERTVGYTLLPSAADLQDELVTAAAGGRELVRDRTTPILRQCLAFCSQSTASVCSVLVLDHVAGSCRSHASDGSDSVSHHSAMQPQRGSSIFRPVCMRGIAGDKFAELCGRQRMWAIELVPDMSLHTPAVKQVRAVASRDECARACLLESAFACRSAEYSESRRLCRLSGDDRRTRPQSMRATRGVDYLENVCARVLPDCRYTAAETGVMIATPHVLEFAASAANCQVACTNERRLECRAFSFDAGENRCYLSADDGISLSGGLVQGVGSLPPDTTIPSSSSSSSATVTSQRVCTLDTCEHGVMSYDKVAGHILRSARRQPLAIPPEAAQTTSDPTSSITALCRRECDSLGSECPAFVVDYGTSAASGAGGSPSCYRLDRSTQGRQRDLQRQAGVHYYEKVCLQGSAASTHCRGRLWAFERVPGRRLVTGVFRVMPRVANRRDCQQACLEAASSSSNPCRSAVYDSIQLECRLSDSTRRRQPESFLSAPITTEYLENQCINEPPCQFRQGGEEVVVEDSHPRYTELAVSGLDSVRACGSLCDSVRHFVCRSFSFHSTTGRCLISGDDEASAGPEAFISRQGTDVYQRVCEGGRDGPSRAVPPSSGTSSSSSSSSSSFPIQTTSASAVESSAASGGLCDHFELVTGVELRPTLANRLRASHLYSDANSAGILRQCVLACSRSPTCAAFNLDHIRRRCVQFELDAGGGVDTQDLAPAPGVSFLQRVCFTSAPACRQLFTFERVLDAELAVRPDRAIPARSAIACQSACLSETAFDCRSATYDPVAQQCALSVENRHSLARAFRRAPGRHYMENHCMRGLSPSPLCRYVNERRDTLLLYPAKAPAVFSDVRCRQACDAETDFSCASYTFLAASGDRRIACLLSAARASELTADSTDTLAGALYAERVCVPVSGGREAGVDLSPTQRPTSVNVAAGSSGVFTAPPPPVSSSSPVADPLRPATRPLNQCRVTPTYEKVVGVTYPSGGEFSLSRGSAGGDALISCLLQCEGNAGCLGAVVRHDVRQQRCYGLRASAGQDGALLTPSDTATYFEKVCLEAATCGKGWTFVRVANRMVVGHDDRVIPDVASREQCQLLCLRDTRLPCRSAEYNYRSGVCSLSTVTRHSLSSAGSALVLSDSVDYMENQCAVDVPQCQYRDVIGRFLPFFDRVHTGVASIEECRSRCDAELDFRCRSYSYVSGRATCYLGGDDTASLGERALVPDVESVYSERTVCRTVRVDCTKTEMLVTFSFGRAFNGRVYVTGHAQSCFDLGSGRHSLVMPIPLGRRCGTTEQEQGRYVNHVVIQQHPTIMQQSDRTVRVECSFDAGDQTITLAPLGGRLAGGSGGGVAVSAAPGPQDSTSVVTNTAPTPSVSLRIVAGGRNSAGGNVNQVALGDDLTFVIIADPGSAFGIFGKSVEARTDNGELLSLIDENGCPYDETIFPALQMDANTRNLMSTFRAFRFPSTARVNFFATVQFCQDSCPSAECSSSARSFGRRRRRSMEEDVSSPSPASLSNLTVTQQPVSDHPLGNISVQWDDGALYEYTVGEHDSAVVSSIDRNSLLPQELPVSASVFVIDESSLPDTTSSYPSGSPQFRSNATTPLSHASFQSGERWDVITSWSQPLLQHGRVERTSDPGSKLCMTRSALIATVVCVVLLVVGLALFAFGFQRLRRRLWLRLVPSSRGPTVLSGNLSGSPERAVKCSVTSPLDLIYADPQSPQPQRSHSGSEYGNRVFHRPVASPFPR